jgi:hypothetical protein
MDVVVSVSLSLLLFGGVVLTVYLIGTLSHHDEGET